jgi:hypothetical protein
MALPSPLLSAAEHVLEEVLGRFWRVLLKRREEGTLAIGDLINTKHGKILNGRGNVQIPNVRKHVKRIVENRRAARKSGFL